MNPPFPAWAQVDLDQLHENVDLIHDRAKTPLAPVIKANAYGHGAQVLAMELSRRKEVAALCVWTMDEAEELRAGGFAGRIIVLGGCLPYDRKRAGLLGVESVIGSAEQARELGRAAGTGKSAAVHLKINTGMSRLGADRQEAFDAYSKIAKMKKVKVCGLMTHFAFAGASASEVRDQVDHFEDVAMALRSAGHTLPPRHAANTAGIFLHPEACYEMVRPGIGIYGIKEFAGGGTGLRPILALKARVLLVRNVTKGETVSYEGTWKSPGKRRVAVVSLGYADGYSRTLSNRIHGIIDGRKVRQIGVICMDVSMFDVSKTSVKEGNVVTLLGSDGAQTISAIDLARIKGTISYEILCGIGNRVRRIYHRSGKPEKRNKK